MWEVQTRLSGRRLARGLMIAATLGTVVGVGCDQRADAAIPVASVDAQADPKLIAQGREIFRYDDFGDWRFWTDTLRLNDAVETLSPKAALGLGLKVDGDLIPADVLKAVQANPALLDDPATTRQLLTLNAVVGVKATVAGDQITRLGITCALCHSTVDNSVMAGIGHRMDGWPNHDLAVGTIVSVAPGLPADLKPVYASWKKGFYDPRFNIDKKNGPLVIPPAYGLQGVELETYTGEGPISYWNNYVGVTQMHAHGSFKDDRLNLNIVVAPQEDEIKAKLPALRQYQLSLNAPAPPANSFDAAAAARGKAVFTGAGRCASCHTGARFTDDKTLHAPSETGADPGYAERSTTKKYRTTPLRGLWQHAPYFHDGSAATLADVVERYNTNLKLGLTAAQKTDLVEFLKSL